MDLPTLNIKGKEVVIVDKNMFQDLIYDRAAKMREDKRKRICGLKEACNIMGCGSTTFYKLLRNPKCLIKKSSVNGKYQIESLERELTRLQKLK